MSSRGFLDQMRRGLDRASFEADRMMRANRVKAAANQLQDQARARTLALGEQVVALYRQQALPQSELAAIAREVLALEAQAQQKLQEAAVIQQETWTEPEPYTPGDPQIGAGTGPTSPRPAPGGDPQIGAATGPAPVPVAPAPPPVMSSTASSRCAACGTVLRPHSAFCPTCGMKQE